MVGVVGLAVGIEAFGEARGSGRVVVVHGCPGGDLEQYGRQGEALFGSAVDKLATVFGIAFAGNNAGYLETFKIWKAILDFDLYVSCHWVSDILVPVFTGQAEAHADPIKEGFREAADELAKLEAQIAGRDWFVGETVSAADITIYPLLEGLLRAAGKPDMEHIDHGLLPFGDRHPNLEAWMNRIRALPGYDETYPANWREIDGAPRQLSKSGGVAGTVTVRLARTLAPGRTLRPPASGKDANRP